FSEARQRCFIADWGVWMRNFYRRSLLAGIAASTFAAPAFAQNAIEDVDSSAVVVASAQAAVQVAAAEAPPAGVMVERVPVTPRRREENLQRVPMAISVVPGALLDITDPVNPQGLAQLVPELYYTSANPRNTAYTIRGLGSNTLSISAANDGI